jgi:hypothetical protein
MWCCGNGPRVLKEARDQVIALVTFTAESQLSTGWRVHCVPQLFWIW